MSAVELHLLLLALCASIYVSAAAINLFVYRQAQGHAYITIACFASLLGSLVPVGYPCTPLALDVHLGDVPNVATAG
jgi:hypothetical protein